MPFQPVRMDHVGRDEPEVPRAEYLLKLRALLVIDEQADLPGEDVEALVGREMDLSRDQFAFRSPEGEKRKGISGLLRPGVDRDELVEQDLAIAFARFNELRL